RIVGKVAGNIERVDQEARWPDRAVSDAAGAVSDTAGAVSDAAAAVSIAARTVGGAVFTVFGFAAGSSPDSTQAADEERVPGRWRMALGVDDGHFVQEQVREDRCPHEAEMITAQVSGGFRW